MTHSIDSAVDGAIHRLAERRTDGPARKPDAAPAQGPDRSADLLDLTGRAREMRALEQDLAKSPEFDAGRVEELRQAIASGRYQVDAGRVADKLLAMEGKLP